MCLSIISNRLQTLISLVFNNSQNPPIRINRGEARQTGTKETITMNILPILFPPKYFCVKALADSCLRRNDERGQE